MAFYTYKYTVRPHFSKHVGTRESSENENFINERAMEKILSGVSLHFCQFARVTCSLYQEIWSNKFRYYRGLIFVIAVLPQDISLLLVISLLFCLGCVSMTSSKQAKHPRLWVLAVVLVLVLVLLFTPT